MNRGLRGWPPLAKMVIELRVLSRTETGCLPSFLRRLMGESEQGAFRVQRWLTSQTKLSLTLPETNSTVYTNVELYLPAGVICLLACTGAGDSDRGPSLFFCQTYPVHTIEPYPRVQWSMDNLISHGPYHPVKTVQCRTTKTLALRVPILSTLRPVVFILAGFGVRSFAKNSTRFTKIGILCSRICSCVSWFPA